MERRSLSPTQRAACRSVAVLVLVLALLAPAGAGAATAAETARELARHLRPAGGASGALVVDLDTGETVFRSRAKRVRLPASIEKLYTTTTALLRFGEDAKLRTQAAAALPSALDGTLDGDLYLRGGGDPTLTTAALQDMADDLVTRTGLSRIEGRVVGDESAFDALRGVPSSGYGISSDIGAQLGALMVDGGRTGKLRPYYQRDPARWAATAFAKALRRSGVRVRPRGRAGTAPAGALPLVTRHSPAMGDLARLANVPSDNYVAEMLLKVIGASTGEQGTTAGGAAVVASTMREQLRIRPRIADGSGLSRLSATSPRQVVRLLRVMPTRDEGDALHDSLAVMGRSGTLASRLRSSPARDRCRGKTGTLRDVSNLAGYCVTARGSRLAFAILMNGVYPPSARSLQDRMVDAIARYSPSRR